MSVECPSSDVECPFHCIFIKIPKEPLVLFMLYFTAGPPLVGVLKDVTGSYNAGMYLCCISLVLVSVISAAERFTMCQPQKQHQVMKC